MTSACVSPIPWGRIKAPLTTITINMVSPAMIANMVIIKGPTDKATGRVDILLKKVPIPELMIPMVAGAATKLTKPIAPIERGITPIKAKGIEARDKIVPPAIANKNAF